MEWSAPGTLRRRRSYILKATGIPVDALRHPCSMDFYQCSGSRTRFGVRVEFARSPDHRGRSHGPVHVPGCLYRGVAGRADQGTDRIEVVTPAFDAVGAKILTAGCSFGEYDVVVVYEAPDDIAAASLALAFGAGGAVRSAKTTRLLSGQEWIDSLQKAQGVSPQYRPAR
jgi:uncharacterized protein with GYD domain